MYDRSGELTVILIIICWLQKLGKDCQQGNKQHKRLLWKGLISRSFSEMEVRKQFQIEISNRFEALENVSDIEDINRVWENIKGSI